jgi:hypothetical protein
MLRMPSSFFSLAALLALAALTTCQPHTTLEPYQTERFDLTAGPAAAEGYPMEVVEGRFTTSDGKGFTVSPKFLEGDWGLSSTTYVTGDGTSPAPDSLEVRWFSYPEDKFYEGRWPMPQKRIYDLLKQGFWNTESKRQETYKDLTVCFLPKGVAVVWLTGANQVLLGRYQGQEVDFDFKRFNEAANRPLMLQQEQAKLPPAVQAQIRTGTLSTKQWDDYLQTYNWQLAFSQPVKLTNQAFGFFNGEDLNYPVSEAAMPAYVQSILTPAQRAVPKNMLLQLEAGYGRRREIIANALDEDELLEAFRTLHAARPAAPLTLYIETDERVTQAQLFLKNDQQQVLLSHAKLEVYSAQ